MILARVVDELTQNTSVYPRRLLRGFASTLGIAIVALLVAVGSAFLGERLIALYSTIILGLALIGNSYFIADAGRLPQD